MTFLDVLCIELSLESHLGGYSLARGGGGGGGGKIPAGARGYDCQPSIVVFFLI